MLKSGRSIVSKLAGYYAYCFIIGDSLIDTSTIYVKNELLKYLQTSGIKKIINTHYHEDHIGNNYTIQQLLGTTVYISTKAIPLIKKSPPKHQRLYLKILWGYPRHSAIISELNNFIKTGDYCFEIIDTPGHCDDHICLYSSELQTAFTGDVFCGTRVKYLRADEDFNKQLETIRKLANLDIKTICCAVCGIVSNGGAELKIKLSFMEEIKEKVLNLHNQGYSDIEIRNEVLGKEGIMNWFSWGHFSKLNMVKSILNRS